MLHSQLTACQLHVLRFGINPIRGEQPHGCESSTHLAGEAHLNIRKGKRKKVGTSAKKDLRPPRPDAPTDVSQIDYWKSRPAS